MKFKLFGLVFIAAFIIQCKSIQKPSEHKVASITKEGFINCFEKGLSLNGKPVWCEASAILYDGDKLLMANDKDMPDNRSSIFYWAFKNGFADTLTSAKYLINPLLKKGTKYEDFAITPDGEYALLTTGFDRVKDGSSEWDGYNCLFFWKIDHESEPQVVSINGTDNTSVSYRSKISGLLGASYFKIEGLAATNDKLYFGIREQGQDYQHFTYKIKILTVSYFIKSNRIVLKDDFSILCDIDIKSIEPSLPQDMGLSSIEYDKDNKRFLILTSYGEGKSFGGYLWIATENELKNNQILIVKASNGEPLIFTHKPEDLTIINDHKIIVIHDDDREITKVGNQVRTENQAAYSIVQFKY